jgi:carboxylesterase type B
MLKPTKEGGDVNAEDAFLPGSPAELLSSRKFHAIPYMTGTNSKEGLSFLMRE